jgi:hypothetical protein
MRPETKQLLKNISIGLGGFLFVGLLLYGAWYGTRADIMTINSIEIIGGETVSHDIVRADIERLLEGDYLGFVPRRFVWTYPRAEMLEVVQATSRVKDPEILREGRMLQVSFAEFESVALWCDADQSDNCVFIDEAGYGFSEAPKLTGGAFVRYIKIGQSASTSEVFTDATDFAQLRLLSGLLNDAGWPVVRVELDQARDAFIHLVGGGELKTSLTLTSKQTIDNLATIRGAAEYQHLSPDNFVYIDLRFGNKVFVNEFGDPIEELPEESIDIENTTSSEVAGD